MFSRPTLQALIAQAFQALQARLSATMPGINVVLRRSVLGVVARVVAGFFDALHGHLDWVVDQAFTTTAGDDAVLREAAEYGLGLLPDAFAAGNVVFAGLNGTPVPLGTEFRGDSNGQLYRTTAAGTIAAGTATVPAQCETGGTAGNLAAGETGTLTLAVPGIQGSVTVAAGGLAGGFADGVDVAGGLRSRLLSRKRLPPQGGNANDYITWTKATPNIGVTSAWCLPAYRGAGTVDVAFVCENRTSIIPLSSDVTAVQDYIDGLCPADADVLVWAPAAFAINVTIHGLQPNNAASQAAVTASLAAAIARYRAPATASSATGLVPYAALDEAVFDTPGVTYESLTVPSADVSVPAGSVPILGTVSFS